MLDSVPTSLSETALAPTATRMFETQFLAKTPGGTDRSAQSARFGHYSTQMAAMKEREIEAHVRGERTLAVFLYGDAIEAAHAMVHAAQYAEETMAKARGLLLVCYANRSATHLLQGPLETRQEVMLLVKDTGPDGQRALSDGEAAEAAAQTLTLFILHLRRV